MVWMMSVFVSQIFGTNCLGKTTVWVYILVNIDTNKTVFGSIESQGWNFIHDTRILDK